MLSSSRTGGSCVAPALWLRYMHQLHVTSCRLMDCLRVLVKPGFLQIERTPAPALSILSVCVCGVVCIKPHRALNRSQVSSRQPRRCWAVEILCVKMTATDKLVTLTFWQYLPNLSEMSAVSFILWCLLKFESEISIVEICCFISSIFVPISPPSHWNSFVCFGEQETWYDVIIANMSSDHLS